MLLPALLLAHRLHHLQVAYLRAQGEYLGLYFLVLLPKSLNFLLYGLPIGRRLVRRVVGVPEDVVLVSWDGIGRQEYGAVWGV